MTLWIVLTVMTSAAAVLVSAPFLRRLDERRAAQSSGVEVYRDQLREIEREEAAGLIENAQAALAAGEIKRRMLAADRTALAERPAQPLSPSFAIMTVAGFVVFGSVTLYATLGRPDLPASVPAAMAIAQSKKALTAGPENIADATAKTSEAPAIASVDDMISRLVQRLNKTPGDAEGWRMLGWSYFHTDRYDEAVKAYAKAAELRPDDAAFQASYGEAIVRASDEKVTPEAKAAFDKAQKLDPKEPRSRFFAGLVLEQQGDKTAALESWVALLKDAGPSDDWAPDLRQRAADLGKEIKASLSPQLASDVAALSRVPTTQNAERGPTSADVQAAASMSEEDRNAMVRRMVDGLANRLTQSPQDAEGWIKLIRARMVLKEPEAAKEALKQAMLAFSGANDEQARVLAAARELGVTQ